MEEKALILKSNKLLTINIIKANFYIYFINIKIRRNYLAFFELKTGLRKFHEISSEDQRKIFSKILNLVIAHGKVPEKDGKLAERKIPLEDAMGLKDLLKIILELNITRHVFDLLRFVVNFDH